MYGYGAQSHLAPLTKGYGRNGQLSIDAELQSADKAFRARASLENTRILLGG